MAGIEPGLLKNQVWEAEGQNGFAEGKEELAERRPPAPVVQFKSFFDLHHLGH